MFKNCVSNFSGLGVSPTSSQGISERIFLGIAGGNGGEGKTETVGIAGNGSGGVGGACGKREQRREWRLREITVKDTGLVENTSEAIVETAK